MISFPPAKINIGLHIQRKRSDAYHMLNAFFIPISFHDILEIVPSQGKEISFVQTGITVDCDVEDNLCVKAYRILEKEYTLPAVKIHLHKQIPFGAGLGGGSADASHTLMLLDKMFKLNLTQDKLLNLALQLGADCPFFIYDKAAFVSGIGEEIIPLNDKVLDEEYQLVILKPELNIPTAKAYQGVNISGNSIDLNTLNRIDISEWKNHLQNDFEYHLFKQFPELDYLKKSLYSKGAIYASMTGSGAALYGVFPQDVVLKDSDFENFVWKGILSI